MRENGRISVCLPITFSLSLSISHCGYYLYVYPPEHHFTHPADKRLSYIADHDSLWLLPICISHQNTTAHILQIKGYAK